MDKTNSDLSKSQRHGHGGFSHLEHIPAGPILTPQEETVAPHDVLLLFGIEFHIPIFVFGSARGSSIC